MKIILVILSILSTQVASANTNLFARYHIESSFYSAPDMDIPPVAEFGAEHYSNPFSPKVRFEASFNTILRDNFEPTWGVRINSVLFQIGVWYYISNYFEIGIDHASWHHVDYSGQPQSYTRAEVNIPLHWMP